MPTAWYALVAILFAPYHNPAPATWVETIGMVKKSIVPIVCGYDDHLTGKWVIADIEGSGFFIDRNGRFVTASHVLDGLDSFQAQHPEHLCSPAIYIPDGGWGEFKKMVDFQYFVFTACQRNTISDIAICTPLENPFTSNRIPKGIIQELEFTTTEIPDGTAVAFSGFPLERTTPVTSIGSVGGKSILDDKDDWFLYTFDKSAWPGASGSPLYTVDGRVIGIIVRTGEAKASGISYARCSSAIVYLISKVLADAKQ
jgi:S1-C subfamily serine protease